MNLPTDASSDQSNAPQGYYRKSNGMLHQLPGNDAETQSNALTSDDLARLDAMSKGELIALVRLCNASMIGVALLTEDEAYEAVCLKLLHGGLMQQDITKALGPLKEWADRKRGKSIERTESRSTSEVITRIERVIVIDNKG